MTGQIAISANETKIITTEVMIGTRRRPEKKASALFSSTPLKRL